MAKATKFYYECLMTCDMGYLAPDQRRERWRNRIVPSMTMHVHRFVPIDPTKEITRQDNCWLVTPRPLGRQYTEPMTKLVDRWVWREGVRRKLPKTSKVKWRQLEPDEVTGHIRQVAIELPLIEDCYETQGEPASSAAV